MKPKLSSAARLRESRLLYQEAPESPIFSAESTPEEKPDQEEQRLFRAHPQLEDAWAQLPADSRETCQRIFARNERLRLAATVSSRHNQERGLLTEEFEEGLASDIAALLRDNSERPDVVLFAEQQVKTFERILFDQGDLAYYWSLREFMTEDGWPQAIINLVDLVFQENRRKLLRDASPSLRSELDTMRTFINWASAFGSVGDDIGIKLSTISQSSEASSDRAAIAQAVSSAIEALDASEFSTQLRSFTNQERALAGL